MAKKNVETKKTYILKMDVTIGEVEHKKGESISLTEKQKEYFITQKFI